MGKFEVKWHRDAAKAFRRLPPEVRQRLESAIDGLCSNPLFGKDIVKLRGKLAGLYRLCVGEYRIVYRIDEERKVVTIEAIGTRGEVY